MEENALVGVAHAQRFSRLSGAQTLDVAQPHDLALTDRKRFKGPRHTPKLLGSEKVSFRPMLLGACPMFGPIAMMLGQK